MQYVVREPKYPEIVICFTFTPTSDLLMMMMMIQDDFEVVFQKPLAQKRKSDAWLNEARLLGKGKGLTVPTGEAAGVGCPRNWQLPLTLPPTNLGIHMDSDRQEREEGGMQR